MGKNSGRFAISDGVTPNWHPCFTKYKMGWRQLTYKTAKCSAMWGDEVKKYFKAFSREYNFQMI